MELWFEDSFPEREKRTFVAEGAKIIGKVIMKEYSSVWFNSVVRGDVNSIYIGKYSNIQDNSVLHVADDYFLEIGDYVTVGHGCILHGCVIRDKCLIGMGATILNGAEIGEGSIVAAGAVVKENFKVPKNSLVAGVPAKIIKTYEEGERLEEIKAQSIKYKDLWTKRYRLLLDNDGETYEGEKIV